ncbi:isochorismatase [Paenibacillus larvae]|uniref:isochorismatase n=2 Tax=Paenibacillus larvae subsp. larvae TaxID=147375 RepID=V9W645_9BACL|nr:isochorismatase [Paenibacillus larvae]AHD05399.1 isochorismatase DhbB [Paenibacillus larvae subsp. larvae DSM 25430]AVG11949.1 isochorismatase DhbB [Paenibacillus larvae subsp. larvae DSM 25430]MDR5569849.1 isochorismatase [Paenibacillus larvae]MDR5595695.1 isochorismatase [Paenibacillus larvae]QHZ52216.1 isochorismatase DhbB [Paenibacillus larvae subsp. larvae]
MAIPAISAYSMPSISDLPNNKVTWKADPKRSVLLIHDMQEYFLDAYRTGESPKVELIENIQFLRNQCKQFGIPVIYTAQPGGQTLQQRGLLQDFWGPGIPDGPYKKRIVEELSPDENDIFLTKWRYSAFKKTNLLDILHEHGRDQLIICGVYAHIGCLLTACDAFMEGIEPFFVADAVADFSLDHHKMAMKYASERCAVTTTTHLLFKEQKSSQASVKKDCSLTLELVRKQVAELLYESLEGISDYEDLIHRGLDSVRIMSLVEKWRLIGADITFARLAERPTISDWWSLLSSQAQSTMSQTDYVIKG